MATPRSLTDVVTLADPRPGTVVGLAPGSRLRLRPGNLVPLVREKSELSFLVFDGAPATLRLERRYARGDVVREVCELRIEVGPADELAASGCRSA
jgi:hypothetical protein